MKLKEIEVVLLVLVGLAAAILLGIYLSGANAPQPTAANDPSASAVSLDGNISNQAGNINESPAEIARPGEPGLTNKTLGELLDEGLGRADGWFRAQYEPADYSIESFRWTMSPSNQTADSVPLKANDLRASVIRFNTHYIDSLRGFAFMLYKPVTIVAPMKIRGTMVFLSNSTQFDGYAQNATEFFIDYDPHPMRTQRMEGCSINSTENFVTERGSYITIYDFNCKIMYGASP